MYPAPVPVAAPHRRPSAWWYAAAGIVAAAGLAAGAAIIATTAIGYGERIDGFDRVEVPGTMEVELSGEGGYSIYHEYAGAYAPDDPFPAPSPRVDVQDPSGEQVPLDVYDSRVGYSTPTHEGIGLYTFRVHTPGTYEVDTSGDTAPGGSLVAVGRGVSTGVITGVISGLLVGFVGVVAGAVIAIVLAIRRSRCRRQLPAQPPGPWPYAMAGAPSPWSPAPPAPPPPPRPPQDAAPRAVRPPAPPPPRRDAAPPPPSPQSSAASLAPGPPPARPVSAFRDPPSLRARDWSSDDLALGWSPDER
jgi:hypothetical protein